jgi:hypothetical protein
MIPPGMVAKKMSWNKKCIAITAQIPACSGFFGLRVQVTKKERCTIFALSMEK